MSDWDNDSHTGTHDGRVRPQAEATFCAKQTLPSNWEKATCACGESRSAASTLQLLKKLLDVEMHRAAIGGNVLEVIERGAYMQ